MAFRFIATVVLVLASQIALAQAGWAVCRLGAAHHARAHHRLARHAAYHIPRFSQMQAEAEVHTQYAYRTPYLPYWVFP